MADDNKNLHGVSQDGSGQNQNGSHNAGSDAGQGTNNNANTPSHEQNADHGNANSLNDGGRGNNDYNGKDPNLEKLSNNYGMDNLNDNLGDSYDPNENEKKPKADKDDPDQKGGQNHSGSPEGAKDSPGQTGSPDKAHNKAGSKGQNNDPNLSGGKKALNSAKKLGGNIKGAMSSFNHTAVDSVMKLSKKAHHPIPQIFAQKIVSGVLTTTLGLALFGGYLATQHKTLNSDPVCSLQNTGDMSYSDAGAGGASGEWTQKGTTSYKHAKQIWDAWVEHGFGGYAIAGILGCIDNEGGFSIPDRAQGHFGDDEKGNGVSEGVTPVGGGAGFYQFTPYTKYAKMGDKKKWLDIQGQTDFVWKSEVSKGLNSLDHRHITAKQLAHNDNIEDATYDWANGYERGQGVASKNDKGMPARYKSAQQAYSQFNGKSVKPDDSRLGGGDTEGVAGNNAANAEDANNAFCDNGDTSTGDTSGIVGTAKQMIGWLDYSQPNRTGFAKHGKYSDVKSVSDVDKKGNADCSSFVWLVLKIAGYKVPDAPYATPAMASDIKGGNKYFKEVDKKDAKKGDVVVVNQGGGSGSNGHTAILEEDWHGDNTKIINEGGMGDNVNEAGFKESFLSLLGGSDIVFGEPIKD